MTDNIIIRNGKPIVIDWMTACIGDPLADVARWELPVAAARLREWIPEEEKRLLMDIVNKNLD